MAPFFMMFFSVQSCTACKRQVLVQFSGIISIGSPLVVCRGCGQVYHTNLRREWYTFKHKALTLLWPFILGCIFLLGGFIINDSNFIFLAPICFVAGFCVSIKNIIQMFLSQKRMRDPAYLLKLLHYRELDQNQYEQFLSKCKK